MKTDTVQMAFKLTEAERAQVKAKAAMNGISLQTLFRGWVRCWIGKDASIEVPTDPRKTNAPARTRTKPRRTK